MGETIGVNVLKRAQNMQVSPQFDGYSGVRIFTGTDDNGDAIIIESGNTSGRVLEIKNPFGSQEMADNILAEINGYQYQPLSADAAHLNPAAEMGDGVTVNGVYSGIFTRATKFGRLMASDISAPTDEEIEHEFAVETASDRQYTRFVQQTKAMLKVTNQAITAEVSARTEADAAINATLSVHATDIAARVTKTGKNGSSTFAWSLDTDGFFIHNGTITQAMKQNKSALFNFTTTGLKIQGEIRATSGTIGGFTIGSSSIYSNGMSSMSSTQTTGVHVGTDGIKLGEGTVYSESLTGQVSLSYANSFGKHNVEGLVLAEYPDKAIYITQGFICRNAYGEVDNLQRGGSDYTASLIGAAIGASEIQIWTDIDGMHNNDPRFVDKTSPIDSLSFEEASELAYFGAKILHPTCVQPAKFAGIPVKLLNTMDPTAPGTTISNKTHRGAIKAGYGNHQ